MNYNHTKYENMLMEYDKLHLYKDPSGSARDQGNKPVEPCLESLGSLFLFYER